MITQDQLKQELHYCPKSGDFKWIKRLNGRRFDRIGTVDALGYRYIVIFRRRYGAHRLAWLYMYGSLPKHSIDHVNGNRSDNKISNLREANHSINSRNASLRKDNKSGMSGISWHTRDKFWSVVISSKCKQIRLGYYEDFFEACCVRKSAEIKYGYHENHGRPNSNYPTSNRTMRVEK